MVHQSCNTINSSDLGLSTKYLGQSYLSFLWLRAMEASICRILKYICFIFHLSLHIKFCYAVQCIYNNALLIRVCQEVIYLLYIFVNLGFGLCTSYEVVHVWRWWPKLLFIFSQFLFFSRSA